MCVLSQSIFGVGVLLWGTPILLMIGIGYLEALSLLLPTSISISAMQILPHPNQLSMNLFIRFLILCMPTLLLGLILIFTFQFDPTIFVIFALILSGILRLLNFTNMTLVSRKYKDVLLPIIGFIHGLSNLGGSVLVIWAATGTKEKIKIRTVVAFIYIFLATFQIIVVHLTIGIFTVVIPYVLGSLLVHLIASKYLFSEINDLHYQILLTMLMFAMAILMSIQYLNMAQ